MKVINNIDLVEFDTLKLRKVEGQWDAEQPLFGHQFLVFHLLFHLCGVLSKLSHIDCTGSVFVSSELICGAELNQTLFETFVTWEEKKLNQGTEIRSTKQEKKRL